MSESIIKKRIRAAISDLDDASDCEPNADRYIARAQAHALIAIAQILQGDTQ